MFNNSKDKTYTKLTSKGFVSNRNVHYSRRIATKTDIFYHARIYNKYGNVFDEFFNIRIIFRPGFNCKANRINNFNIFTFPIVVLSRKAAELDGN